VIARDADRASVDQLAGIPLMGARGVMASLGQVATIEQSTGPSQINRRDRQRYVAIQSEITGRALGDVVRDIQQQTAAIQLPAGFKITFTGDTEAQEQTFREILGALLLSVLLMVALYESLLSPFVVMLSLPLAVVGAIVGLWISGDTLNMMSMIGMIMLMGLVGKNAILLVDYTNTLRRRGEERDVALLHAGPTRLRPILMTTAAMITAMMPAALRLGEGAEMRAALAVVVIGGLLSSTLLTLVMIPAIYTIVDDLQSLVARTFGSFRLPRRHDTPGATPPVGPASVEDRQLAAR
jgi:HAE1 family hydrophobic/amphiphilic exporter-1